MVSMHYLINAYMKNGGILPNYEAAAVTNNFL